MNENSWDWCSYGGHSPGQVESHVPGVAAGRLPVPAGVIAAEGGEQLRPLAVMVADLLRLHDLQVVDADVHLGTQTGQVVERLDLKYAGTFRYVGGKWCTGVVGKLSGAKTDWNNRDQFSWVGQSSSQIKCYVITVLHHHRHHRLHHTYALRLLFRLHFRFLKL